MIMEMLVDHLELERDVKLEKVKRKSEMNFFTSKKQKRLTQLRSFEVKI